MDAEWIVEQACGHVYLWVPATSWENFNTPRPPSDPQPCKGAPIVGWGEWCPRCRDVLPVTRVGA